MYKDYIENTFHKVFTSLRQFCYFSLTQGYVGEKVLNHFSEMPREHRKLTKRVWPSWQQYCIYRHSNFYCKILDLSVGLIMVNASSCASYITCHWFSEGAFIVDLDIQGE